MSTRPVILLVEKDDSLAEMISLHLQATVDAEVIHTRNAAETIHLELDQPPDLLLADIKLPDGNGLDLIRLLRSSRSYPVLIMTDEPTLGRAVEAMRLGVRDLFVKPFDLARLTTVVKEILAETARQQRTGQRLERLEKLVRKVLDERKALQQRIDLVCRDLVGAYHDLAERFVEHAHQHRGD